MEQNTQNLVYRSTLIKSKNILFSIIYLLFTVGVAVSSHYCLGRISHQDVFSFDNHGCMCDEVLGDSDDCCKDEIAIVTINDDQQVSSRLQHIVPKLTVLFAFDLKGEITFMPYDNDRLHIAQFEDPPPKVRLPLYLIYSSYTFYG